MNWFTGVVVYVLIWWTALFAVLPVGTRPVEDPDAHTGWRGAPERPLMLRKVIATTILAAVLWGLCYALIASDLISFRHGLFAAPPLPG
jgi:predicted secreted protein